MFFSSPGGGGMNEVVRGRFLSDLQGQINRTKAMIRDDVSEVLVSAKSCCQRSSGVSKLVASGEFWHQHFCTWQDILSTE